MKYKDAIKILDPETSQAALDHIPGAQNRLNALNTARKLACDAMRQVEGEIRLSDPYRDMIKLSKEDTEAVNGLVRWKRAYRKARK